MLRAFQMNHTLWLVRCVVFFFAIAAPLVAWGQFSTGITGRVDDSTGAVISGATVIARNKLTNEELKTHTNSSGNFSFTSVKPGLYDVSASAAGFATAQETDIHLQLEATVTVRLTLKPGAATDSVTVHAEEAQIDLTHADRGEVEHDAIPPPTSCKYL